MISAKDFTSIEKKDRPDDPGKYILLLKRGRFKFYSFATFAPSLNPNEFMPDSLLSEGVELLAWAQIDNAENIAERLNRQS